MTFVEARKLIKVGDVIRLRNELQSGLDPNLANRYSWTLLMIAALEGNTSIGALLIEGGAELDRRNAGNETALSLAAHTGHAGFVHLLLTSGASLDCRPFGNTFEAWFTWACQYGRCSEKIRALFDRERKIRAERDHALDQLT
jgi:ankyrin repeat protein